MYLSFACLQSKNVEEMATKLGEIEITAQPEEEGSKSTRAAKRRAKKAAKEQEREKRIAEGEAESITHVRNVEAEKMKNILNERNLQIFEVKS